MHCCPDRFVLFSLPNSHSMITKPEIFLIFVALAIVYLENNFQAVNNMKDLGGATREEREGRSSGKFFNLQMSRKDFPEAV